MTPAGRTPGTLPGWEDHAKFQEWALALYGNFGAPEVRHAWNGYSTALTHFRHSHDILTAECARLRGALSLLVRTIHDSQNHGFTVNQQDCIEDAMKPARAALDGGK